MSIFSRDLVPSSSHTGPIEAGLSTISTIASVNYVDPVISRTSALDIDEDVGAAHESPLQP